MARRPGWGNVYNYNVMYGDYKQHINDNSDAPFLEQCENFYDYMDEVLNEDEEYY